jgi:predicted negative regulator of RcsB-dependent stress response
MSSPATESTRLIEFLAWVDVNKKKLLIGAGVVGIAIAAYAIHQSRRDQTEAEANAALLKLDTPGSGPETAPGPTAQAFLQVVTKYPGTQAGLRALLLGAAALFREDKYDDARRQFESFLREYADNPLAPMAALGVAACLDAMNKTNEALAAYQNVTSRYSGSVVAPQAKLGMARIYEARNEFDQALKIYDEVARPTTPAAWNAEAAILRERLLFQHPELVRTNAPAAAASLSALSNAPATNPPQLTATNPAPAKTLNTK